VKILCVFGEHQYGKPSLGVGTEFAAFIPALRKLGHDVVHFESWNRARYKDFADLNRALLAAVDRERPQVLFASHQLYEIWTETLAALKARNDLVTINWCTDDSWKYREVSRFIGPHYHAMVTTDPDVIPAYHRDGIEGVLLSQWAARDDSLLAPIPAQACKHAVTFVGAAHGNRRERVARLREAGVEIECFGNGWPSGPIAVERIPEIMQTSVISLNFANSSGHNQIKARTFEVPGAGGFLLTEEAPHLDRWFERGREIEVFRDDAELAKKVQYYLANPSVRDSIAIAGHERTRREHTYAVRLEAVLRCALEGWRRGAVGIPDGVAKPPKVPFEAHRMGLALSAIRTVMIWAGKMIWGPRRGPRAARRAAFEVCWRLAGKRTFGAAGWPGRMFYEYT